MHILISAVSSARHPSGICRHAANLARSLSENHGISQVTMLVGRWQQTYFQSAFDLSQRRLHMVAVDIRNDPYSRNLWYWRALPGICGRFRPDIVHLSFPVPFVRQRFACPVVSSLHDLYPFDTPGNVGALRALFTRRFLRQCIKQSDSVLCSSDFTLSRLRCLTPELAARKAARIYPSITVDIGSCRTPHLPELNGQQFLLTVAQHRRNKNLRLLLSAFARLRSCSDSHRELRLVIVGGDGPETKHLRLAVQRHSLQGHVLFDSALPDPELCWLYRNCAALIAPSAIEGFGLPIAEALRCGARVLCSDIPVFHEIGGSRVRYFDLHRYEPAQDLACAIDALLHQPKPAPLISDAFSPRKIAMQHIALYSKLAKADIYHSLGSQFREIGAVAHDRYAS